MKTIKLVHPVAAIVAALIGLSAGACKESDVRIDRVCKRHCEKMKDCNNTDYDTCLNNCVETAHECDTDSDVDMALDKLDECRNSECSEVLGCGIDAWFECKL